MRLLSNAASKNCGFGHIVRSTPKYNFKFQILENENFQIFNPTNQKDTNNRASMNFLCFFSLSRNLFKTFFWRTFCVLRITENTTAASEEYWIL